MYGYDASLPGQNFLQFSQSIFTLTANVPYDFGPVTQLLNEIYDFRTFNTSSVRNISVRSSMDAFSHGPLGSNHHWH